MSRKRNWWENNEFMEWSDNHPMLGSEAVDDEVVDKSPGAGKNSSGGPYIAQDYSKNPYDTTGKEFSTKFFVYKDENSVLGGNESLGAKVLNGNSKRNPNDSREYRTRFTIQNNKNGYQDKNHEVSIGSDKKSGNSKTLEEWMRLNQEQKKNSSGSKGQSGNSGSGSGCDCDKKKEEEKKTGEQIGEQAAQAGNAASSGGTSTSGGGSTGSGSTGSSTSGAGSQGDDGCNCSGESSGSGSSASVRDKSNPVVAANYFFNKNGYVPFTAEIEGIPISQYKNITSKEVILPIEKIKNKQVDFFRLEPILEMLKHCQNKFKEASKQIELRDGQLKSMSNFLNGHIAFDLAMFWNAYYWGPSMANEAFNEGPLDKMAKDLGNRLLDYEQEIETYNNAYREMKSAERSVLSLIKPADFINFGDGVILEKLDYEPRHDSTTTIATIAGFGAVAIHKNHKTAESTYVLYEIIIDGVTFKYGIADASRRTAGNVPVRIAQQISKLRRLVASDGGLVEITYKIKLVLNTSKGTISDMELYRILKRMEDIGIPIGNIAQTKKFINAKIRKLTPRGMRLISRYFKI